MRLQACACHAHWLCLQVIQFTMQGVPGHFVVSGKVEFKSRARAKDFQKIQLAGAEKQQPAKRRKVP